MPESQARLLAITGVVQGVGFRPFVYRTAQRLNLTGWVLNDVTGVRVHAEGAPDVLDALEAALRERAPAAARVSSITVTSAEPKGFAAFEIRQSTDGGAPTTRISPDLCICDDCVREMQDRDDRRFRYPYINCTNCGPRYSIIRSLPYDRPRTTMAAWPLCNQCQGEYEDPSNRRYHAQPTACARCGPAYSLWIDGMPTAAEQDAIDEAARMLAEGMILAVKGIGGYHLACDARNRTAVTELRERKYRKEKPFAVMARDTAAALRLANMETAHIQLLESAARPIVLAPARGVLEGVHPGAREIGIMLPYAPLHHLLFRSGAPGHLVLTSANRSSEPIAYRDDDALESLDGIADAFLIGERPIQRRVDDSVVAIRRDQPFMIRRSRGYAPESVAALETDRPILAMGADLKNTIALAVGGEVFVSQHVGDLGDLETDRAYRETIEDFLTMYAVDSRDLVIAHDLHPEYVTTRIARVLPAAERTAIQHHEAHIASVLLEHNKLDDRVVGIALDGTGYGHDGTVWGGELLVGSVSSGFERARSLKPVMMPGGDAASRHPVQAAAAYLRDIAPEDMESAPFRFPSNFRQACGMVRRGTRCIASTSTGRLFDAVAAVCGFTRGVTFEGQAAIWLEHLAEHARLSTTAPALDPTAMVLSAVHRRASGLEPGAIAAAFHAELAQALASAAVRVAEIAHASTVVVSGGVWQNALLLDLFSRALPTDLRLLGNRNVPCNDGGVSVGQIALAARHARATLDSTA